MKYRTLISAVFVAALGLGASACTEMPPTTTVRPTAAVDQQYIATSSNGVGDVGFCRIPGEIGTLKGQTFTAGRSGELTQVSLVLDKYLTPGGLKLSVQTLTAGGLPSGTILGSGIYQGPGSADDFTFIDIPLTVPANVTAGQQYVIVADFDGPCEDGGWGLLASTDTPDYLGGRGVTTNVAAPVWQLIPSSTWDFFFKTWVA